LGEPDVITIKDCDIVVLVTSCVVVAVDNWPVEWLLFCTETNSFDVVDAVTFPTNTLGEPDVITIKNCDIVVLVTSCVVVAVDNWPESAIISEPEVTCLEGCTIVG
jgi:hypothetical protein